VFCVGSAPSAGSRAMKPDTLSMFSATRGLACISEKSDNAGGDSMRGIWIVGGSAKAMLATKTGSPRWTLNRNQRRDLFLSAGSMAYGDEASAIPAATTHT
jgi:hypothetical protein